MTAPPLDEPARGTVHATPPPRWASPGPAFSIPTGASSASHAPLENLPSELIQLIVDCLPHPDLKNVALVSKSAYLFALPRLWQNVSLVDTWTLHNTDGSCQVWTDRGQGEPDEHDDTPIIRKLYILASNPFIASKVHTLTHRCHLPTPSIFHELPRLHFHGENLSQDYRTLKLLRLAIRNLANVQVLHIVFGHHNLTQALLEGFLDPARPRNVDVRKLWLESVSLLSAQLAFQGQNTLGLESIRIRRLRGERATGQVRPSLRPYENTLARGGFFVPYHNGAGGSLTTTCRVEVDRELPIRSLTPQELFDKAAEFDAIIWGALPDVAAFVEQARMPALSSRLAPRAPMEFLFHISSLTLTKLTLDWILWRRDGNDDSPLGLQLVAELSKMRFPNLRAFQFRNAVVLPTMLPPEVYLLEPGAPGHPSFLDFMEAHPKIQCLAWPLDRFYSHNKPEPSVLSRSRSLVALLGTCLVNLRVDAQHHQEGETLTDHRLNLESVQSCIRRRRFIAEFASHMTKVQQVKLEGGLPRDEKREILRALHFSPLEKIVLIGVSFPCGNTWGFEAEDIRAVDEGHHEWRGFLEEEDKAAILASYSTEPSVAEPFEFIPEYEWGPSPPLIHTIAAHHASTITELKFCGYNGSPILSDATPITRPILDPLRYFHNLRQLVLSMWLFTWFEDADRDMEIIQSWVDTRSPSSTALAIVTPGGISPSASPTSSPVALAATLTVPSAVAQPQESNRWAATLKKKYTPSALAHRVAADIGPYLSPIAKARNGGVRVRASFCLGEHDNADIFDLDCRIGTNNEVLDFLGPREEAELGRWWGKLRDRQWF